VARWARRELAARRNYIGGVPSLDPDEPKPIDPASVDPTVGASWSALEAAGLLPKRNLGESFHDEGLPTDTSPSGTTWVIPPPPPPAPRPAKPRVVIRPVEVVRPSTVVDPVVLDPAVVATANEPASELASTDVAALVLPEVVEAAPPVEFLPMEVPAVATAAVAPAHARVEAAPALVSGPRIDGRTVGRRRVFRRRPRIRKVSRVVRHIDGWTVFKISLVLYALLYVVLLIAGVLLWHLAYTTGTVDNIQGFIKELFGLKTFAINGKKLFQASRKLGLIMAIGGTGLHVTLVVLFNLIADLVGGVRVTVLEEEVVLRDRNEAAAEVSD
jgi:hypothetical protein